jgi:hypothetical protein
MDLKAIDKWHKTRTGHLTFGVAELAMAYGFASWAIDTGSLWQYALAVILLVGGVANLFRIAWPKK